MFLLCLLSKTVLSTSLLPLVLYPGEGTKAWLKFLLFILMINGCSLMNWTLLHTPSLFIWKSLSLFHCMYYILHLKMWTMFTHHSFFALSSTDNRGHTTKLKFTCMQCNREFVNTRNLNVHIRDAHGENRGPFCCPCCNKLQKNRSCLRIHLSNFHNVRGKKIIESCVPKDLHHVTFWY